MEVVFSDREQAWLARYAREAGLSASAVVRIAVRNLMQERPCEKSETRKKSAQGKSGDGK